MATKKWSDIKAKKFTPEELRQLDLEIQRELLKMSGERTGPAEDNSAK
jgi:hypothetical protein